MAQASDGTLSLDVTSGALRSNLGRVAGLALIVIAALPSFWLGVYPILRAAIEPDHWFELFVFTACSVPLLWTVGPLVTDAGKLPRASWQGALAVAAALLVALLGNWAWLDDLILIGIVIWAAGGLALCLGHHRALPLVSPLASLLILLPPPGSAWESVRQGLEHQTASFGLQIASWFGARGGLHEGSLQIGSIALPVSELTTGVSASLAALLAVPVLIATRKTRSPRLIPAALVALASLCLLQPAISAIAAAHFRATGAGMSVAFWTGNLIAMLALSLPYSLALSIRRPWPDEDRPADTTGGRSLALSGVLPPTGPMLFSAGASCISLAALLLSLGSPDPNVSRQTFDRFPQSAGEWVGTRSSIESRHELILSADDYINMEFHHPEERAPVTLWSAYYRSQSLRAPAIHSPQACLPNAGMQITSREVVRVDLGPGSKSQMQATRVIATHEGGRFLIYYWVQRRGQAYARERLARLATRLDGLMTGRTDGALVRYSTPLLPGEDEAHADRRVVNLIVRTSGLLSRYIPE